MEVGYKYGLMPVYAYNAMMPEAYTKARGISALGYAEYHSAEFTKVLEDIQKFRPDVRFEDLFSGLYYVVFNFLFVFDVNNLPVCFSHAILRPFPDNSCLLRAISDP